MNVAQTEATLVSPHGGKLIPLLVPEQEQKASVERAGSMPKIHMSSRETSDLIMLACGAFSPLQGFMCSPDYKSVVHDMRMQNGLLWPIPITLAVSKEKSEEIETGSEAALVDGDTGEIMGSITVKEKYEYDKKTEAECVFGTTDQEHPGVAKVYAQEDILLGGEVKVFSEGKYPEIYGDYYARPSQTRELFQNKGWKTVAAFQTRNPLHRSHEYCTKIAMEVCDGLLLHPLVGKLKKGDIPAETRMKCYEALLENYYPEDRAVCRVYPMEMRYGGPREAVLHAIFRQNYGCSHLVIGRDHAGVGNYYGPFDAQNIFDEFDSSELKIQPLKIDWTFWCYKCQGMASTKTCPHPKEDHLMISGTDLRSMLAAGESPPPEFSRKEVLDILKDYYQQIK